MYSTQVFVYTQRQIVILPYPQIRMIESNELSNTERGEGGFGSTGN